MRYWLGQPVRLSSTVRQLNVDGTTTLVNPTTAVYLVKVRAADGTTTTTGTYSSPTNDGTGLLHQDIPASDLTIPGHYQWTLTTTGSGAGVQVGDFDVADPFEPALLPLQDAKDALNIPQSNTAADSEIQSYLATIESALESYTGGPLLNTTVSSERAELTSGYTVILVRQRPLVSVTSITAAASGTAIDISGGLDIDPNAGTIRRKLAGWPFILPVFTAFPVVLVTYVAGWGAAPPAAFNTAARIILQHLWETQHGPSGRPSMGGGEMASLPGFGFAIPNQAAELLDGAQGGVPFMAEVFV